MSHITPTNLKIGARASRLESFIVRVVTSLGLLCWVHRQ
jgi:hypothetical protein